VVVGRADRSSLRVRLGGDRLIRVGLFQGDLGNEHLPRNAPEGRLIDVMELNGIVFEKLTRTGR
jgi:hypothetical protein